MTIRNELVSYETAKLAKEKGFSGECFYHFDINGNLSENSDIVNIGCEGGLVTEDHLLYNHPGNPLTTAPFKSSLQRWLREKHNLQMTIDNWINQPVDNEMWPICYQVYVNGEGLHPYFKTYEETLEFGLQ
jgi:hypothetical protein